jgi:hypothetical protein
MGYDADSSEEEDDWEAHVEHGLITQEAHGLEVMHTRAHRLQHRYGMLCRRLVLLLRCY